MGLNLYGYDGLQPKTTPPKHISWQCIKKSRHARPGPPWGCDEVKNWMDLMQKCCFHTIWGPSTLFFYFFIYFLLYLALALYFASLGSWITWFISSWEKNNCCVKMSKFTKWHSKLSWMNKVFILSNITLLSFTEQ